MPYAAIADLIARYGEDELIQLTDRTGSGAVGTAIAQRALDDAEAEVNGYLAVRHALPLASVPPLLARITCDIARYRLWDDRASEEVRARYEDARRVLEALAAGRVTLGVTPPDAPSGPAPSAQPGRSVFDERGMAGW